MSVTSRDSRRKSFSVSVLTNFFESGGVLQHLFKESLNDSGHSSSTSWMKKDEVKKLNEEHLVAERRKLFQNSTNPIDLNPSNGPKYIKSMPPTKSINMVEKNNFQQQEGVIRHRHSYEDIQKTRKSVMDTIIKYIEGDVSEDDIEEDTSIEISQNEIEECEDMMKDIQKSWSHINLFVDNIDEDDNENFYENENESLYGNINENINENINDNINDNINENFNENINENINECINKNVVNIDGVKNDVEECGDEENKEISNCIKEIQTDFNNLYDSAKELDQNERKELNLRRSVNFVKSNRSSSKRRKMKKKPDNIDNVVYPYDNKNQEISSPEPTPINSSDNSILNNFSFEINDDFFGKMLEPIDFIVETYNNKEENVLYKLILKREPILIPNEVYKDENRFSCESTCSSSNSNVNLNDSEDIKILLKITQPEDDFRNFESEDEGLNQNDYDAQVYENFSIENGNVKEKINHAYENWTVCDKDNNQRITITHESVLNGKFLQVPGGIPPKLLPSPKKQHIIDELKQTELKFLDGLEYVIHQYLKHFKNHPNVKQIGMGISQIFGNIEDIFEANQKFYERLLQCNYSVEKIAKLFLESEYIFLLSSDYMRNKYKTQHIYEQYIGALSERQKQLNDKKTCDSYLLTPVQRTTRYKLLLESLLKDLKKNGEETTLLEKAIDFIDKNISEANRLLAIDSIRNCPINLTNKGPLLLKDSFNIKRKYRSLIFLFKDVVVFTVESKAKQDIFEYKDSILLSDLSLKHQTNSNVFTLINFPKSKMETNRFEDNTSFEIEAVNSKTCNLWVNKIRDILWVQLNSYKQNRKTMTNLTPSPTNENKGRSSCVFTLLEGLHTHPI
ncbi:rhoGEF domain-containing protein gxcJ-like isoform X2 [Onthophagus taurus]|uniref:rhoGEF domain-containing protein gxcJ-like isoform X2 n=1 Tax=Onthophagus taurus TaxID=166361 RepID=UPI0039BEC22D